MSEYRINLRSTIPDDLGGKIVGTLMGLLCLAIGLWIMQMGLEGATPAQPLLPRDIPGFLAFGALFVWGGIQTIILALGGSRLPRWIHVVLISVFLCCLGVPFLIIGILTPDQIQASFSIDTTRVIGSKGGHAGGIIFVGVGTLLLLSIPIVVRFLMAKKSERDDGYPTPTNYQATRGQSDITHKRHQK